MMRYAVYGIIVESEIELPELPHASRAPDLRIARGAVPEPQGRWTDIWQRDDGTPWTRVQRVDGSYHIRYEREADFLYSRRRATLTIDAHDCAPPTLRHLLLDQVLPLVLSLDTLTLHASAVAIGGSTAAFLGPAGSGKSTCAVLLARQGHAIVADDVLVVKMEGAAARAIAGYGGVRLCDDIRAIVTAPAPAERSESDGAKGRILDGLPFATSPPSLEHVFVLDDRRPPQPILERLSARDTAVALLEHSYRLDQRDAAFVTSEVQRACDAASRIRGWRLAYAREVDRWIEIADAIRAQVAAEDLSAASS